MVPPNAIKILTFKRNENEYVPISYVEPSFICLRTKNPEKNCMNSFPNYYFHLRISLRMWFRFCFFFVLYFSVYETSSSITTPGILSAFYVQTRQNHPNNIVTIFLEKNRISKREAELSRPSKCGFEGNI